MKALHEFWRDYRLIWKHAVNYRCTRSHIWMGWGLLPVGLSLGLLLGAPSGEWRKAIIFGAGLPIVCFCGYYWAMLVSGACAQNSPSNAKLTPRIRVRVMQAVALTGVIGAVGLATIVFGVNHGQFGWCFLFLFVGMYTIGIGLISATLVEGGLLFMLSAAYYYIVRFLPSEIISFLSSEAAQFIGMILLAATGYYFLQMAFPRGSERHWKKQSLSWKQGTRTLSTGEKVMPAGSAGGLYAMALRHDCAKQSCRKRLILHVLGPTGHWSAYVPFITGFLVLALLAKAWLLLAPRPHFEVFLSNGWLFVIFFVGFLQTSTAWHAVARMSATSTEQAIFRLAPLAPSPRHFNRQLAKNLLRTELLRWLIFSCTGLVLALLMGFSAHLLVRVFASCCVLLPQIAMPLRDYTSSTRLYNSLPQFFYGWIVTTMQCTLAALIHSGFALIAISVVITITMVGWRWRKMLASPIAFPVWRMDDKAGKPGFIMRHAELRRSARLE